MKQNPRYRSFWDRVCTEKYPTILNMARYLTGGNEDRARDLAQTVVWRLLHYCPPPATVLNVPAYLFRTTRNAWKDSLQAVNELSLTELEKNSSVPQPVSLEARILNELDRERSLRAFELGEESETEKFFRTVELRAQGFTFPEIAGLLQENVRNTRYRWYRHHANLRRRLR